MADIFFSKFSELISSQNVLNENEKNTEQKNKILRTKDKNILNNKILFYISILISLGIAIYFII